MPERFFAGMKKLNFSDKTWFNIVFMLIILISSFSTVLILQIYYSKINVKLPVIAEYYINAKKTEINHLRVGVIPGPYADMFKEAIEPSLLKKGYTIEYVFYNSYSEPNFALAEEKIDLNMFQNYRYLNSFKFIHDVDLSAITELPTAMMGIFSHKHTSLNNLPINATVAIPSDATNRSRALMLLEKSGLVRISSYVDKTKANIANLSENPKNLQFMFMDAKDLPNALNQYDLAVINGNFALSSGLELTDALHREVMTEGYINVIAVRSTDLSQNFVKDIIEIINSEECRKILTDPNTQYADFQRPGNLLGLNRPGEQI